MSEMVERVARAMMEQDALGATADGPGIHRGGWRAYEGMARAAIEAMRLPTEAMIEAAMPGQLGDGGAAGRWRAMIDEALKP